MYNLSHTLLTLRCLVEKMEMGGKPIDVALRTFQQLFRMPVSIHLTLVPCPTHFHYTLLEAISFGIIITKILTLLLTHTHAGRGPEDRQNHGSICSGVLQAQRGHISSQVGGCSLHPLIRHHDAPHLTSQPQRQDEDLQETMGDHEQRYV